MKIKFCDRCSAQLDRMYHDGSLALSSQNNRNDIGLPITGFIMLCDNCYWEYHHAMKFWLSGKDAKVVRA